MSTDAIFRFVTDDLTTDVYISHDGFADDAKGHLKKMVEAQENANHNATFLETFIRIVEDATIVKFDDRAEPNYLYIITDLDSFIEPRIDVVVQNKYVFKNHLAVFLSQNDETLKDL
jgi:hypothetical protein